MRTVRDSPPRLQARGGLAVVVLAGGDGIRIGGRKALRQIDPATTLLGRALATARLWSPYVAVVARSADQAGDLGDVGLILDDASLEGPIAGLSSAFDFAAAKGVRHLLTAPCDTPFLPPDLPRRLSGGLTPAVLAAVACSCGRLHPTCALWRLEASARLPAYRATGGRSLRGFAEFCGMAVVDWPVGDRQDPFFNVNTVEDLATARRREPRVGPHAL
jgi:molybdopterin-guanine dinucleotide biosynthesis protein A